ncbi:MAG: helix-turn-helix transcriptional regulator [Aeromicrobium sp.]|uniref:helix-turn-helix domain-containing protein n=1 Tax=Aeromicrobium sp. TaxID=1871063 RepID=UPI0039E2ECED
MTPVELQARREALGMTQASLAALLGVTQGSVSHWEARRRPIPDGIDAELRDIEDYFAELVAEIADLVEHASALHDRPDIDFVTFTTDEAFWASDARARRLLAPASLHRVATAHAAWMAREEWGIDVRIEGKD